MNLQLTGQTVAVMGAARGIGRAMVTAFAGEGCRVYGFDRAEPAEFAAGGKAGAGEATRADAVPLADGGAWPTERMAGASDATPAGGATGAGEAPRVNGASSRGGGEAARVDAGSAADGGAWPAGATFVRGDAMKLEEVARFAEVCGETDHLVFCIGAGSGKAGFPFWNLSPADWPRVLELNLVSAVNAAHAFAPNFVRRRRGSLLFLVSVAGQTGSPTDPPYSAAKAGLINFVHCAARDFAAYGVRVNALSPGMVKTDLNQSVWEALQRTLPPAERRDYATWAEEKIRRISPLGRWQTAEECAALAAFIASDHARSITGQTLNVDGGQVMHA
jgi:2-hydroxycyclohexanecarboxyl-CoA dehydrogenase